LAKVQVGDPLKGYRPPQSRAAQRPYALMLTIPL